MLRTEQVDRWTTVPWNHLISGCVAPRLQDAQVRPAEQAMRVEPYKPTLLEASFPFREVSLVLRADRRINDPAYRVHRWWARRPPGLMRALLIAAASDAGASSDEFWQDFASDTPLLSDLKVLDPFAGGGTTLVEARRLGAKVWGGDVDPLAVAITKYELNPANRNDVEVAGAALLEHLSSQLGRYYPAPSKTPLHYFTLRLVTCPGCDYENLLYRSLALARYTGARGSVVRDAGLTVFCPTCRDIHRLADPDRQRLHCCGEYHSIWEGTYTAGRYSCPSCGSRSSHQDLKTGGAPSILIAVEETADDAYREVRAPKAHDHDAIRRAGNYWSEKREAFSWSSRKIGTTRDGRPQSFGIVDLDQLFTPRQLLLFALAKQWIAEADTDQPVRAALSLAVSNAVTTNNRLCGYATDYGRISPLFSVRGYALPSMSVELNPLHPSAGRGTLPACLQRVAKASEARVLRHVWNPKRRRVERHVFGFEENRKGIDFGLRSATRSIPEARLHSAQLCVFDPPYFDFIDYDELSHLQRVMMGLSRRGGVPLFPEGDNDHQFQESLALAFRRCVEATQDGMPLVFTYHASSKQAWDVVGEALDEAKLRVTAAWPVLSDVHMGHHSFPGNCEWDVAITCRSVEAVIPMRTEATAAEWVSRVAPLKVSKTDQLNFQYAIEICKERFGVATGGTENEDSRGT